MNVLIKATPRLLALFAVLLISLIPEYSYADWITRAIFSERAAIDSINRFMVIRHDVQEKVYGQQILPLGDINGDNISDIVLAEWEPNAFIPDNADLYYGSLDADTTADGFFNDIPVILKKIGDVNNDGYIDFGRYHYPDSGFGIYFGGPDFDDAFDFFIPHVLSFASLAW